MHAQLRGLLVRLHLGSPGLSRRLEQLLNGLAPIGDKHARQRGQQLGMFLRLPFHNLVACDLQLLHRQLESSRDGRRRRANAVVPEHGDLEDTLGGDGPPGDGEALRVVDPRLLADNGLGPENDLFEGRCHRSVHAVHGFLSGQTGAGLEVGESAEGGSDGEDAGAGGGDAEGAT